MEIAEHDESKCYPDTVATAHITDDPEQVYKEKAQKKLENFQIHVKERFRALIARSDPLSLSWIRQLFKVFLSCLKEFKELLDHNGRDLKRGVRNRLISPCVFICLRSLELLNGIRDGLLYVEEWGGEVLKMLLLLCTPNVGRPQFDKARNALNRLSISIQNEKESNWALADSMEENEGNLNLEPARRFSSRVSRMWSASMQLKLLRTSLFLPTLGDNAVTNGIADSAFTMGCVQFTVLFCLVAAVPCQGRRIDASFFEEHMSPYRWYEPLHSIWKKIYEEARKAENLYCCGLLNEVCLIEQCTRDLSNLINSVEYPLTQENREERAQVVKKLRNIDAALEDGLEPLDEELKDGWSKIASFRIEVENWKNWLHG
ncbi:protein BYPASS1-LIKE-like [Cornus florida]|uniref:protein BYPASS1-LIKE-like n=1 Tax=Cornus florida TaxID=4283 RepID=UPI00289FF23D|nr:protein BYPASS1-LIKE-like [Cornus florida]